MGIMGQHQLFLKATLFLVLGCSWCHLAEAKDPFFQQRRNSRHLINDPSFIPLGDQVPLEPVEHRGLPEPPLFDDDAFGYLLQTTTEAMTDDMFEPASPPPPYVEPTPSVTEQYPYEQEPENNQIRPFDERPWWDSQPFPRKNVASGRSLFDNVPKTSEDSYASSFFPDRIFGSPPTPKDLGFPSIENTEDNWLFDVDWSSFGRRKRRSPVPVTTGTRSTASRTGTKPTAPAARQTREGASTPKEEYDGPYIYTQLFGPPYEVGYIRSPIPSKHVYQDYLQFVRSWSAASRDAVDEQLQANPASIDTYKSVKASGGAGSYDNNDQSYKETVQKDAYKETSGVQSQGETLFRKEPATYGDSAYPPAPSNTKSPALALNYHSPQIGYEAPETEFRPTNKAYHTAAAGAKSPVYVESGFTPLKNNNKQPSYDSPTTYRPGTVTNGDAYASPVAAIKYDSVKPTSNKPAAYQTPAGNQNYNSPSSQQDYQSGDSLPISYDILKPFNNYDKKNDNSYEPVTKYKTPESGLYQESPAAYKEEEKKNPTYEDDLYPAAAPVYEEESYKSPPYQEESYKSPAYKEEPKTVAVLYKEEPVYKAPVLSYKEEPAYKAPVISYKEESYNSAPATYKEESYKEEPYNKEKTPVYEDESYKEPTYKPTPAYKETVAYKEESYIKVPLNKEVPVYKEETSYKNIAPVYKEESYEKTPAYKEEPYKSSAPVYKEESYEKAPIYKEEPYKPAQPVYKDEPYEKVLPYREDPYEKPSGYKEEPYKPAPSYKEEPYEKAPVYKAEEAYKPSGPTYKDESYGNTVPAYKDQPYENKAPAVYKDESYEKTPAYKEQSYESKPPAYKEESYKPASQYKEESYQAAPAYKEEPYKEAPKNVYQDAPSRSPYPGSYPTRYVEPPPYETASAVIKNPYKSNSYDQNPPPSVKTYPKYDEPSVPSYDKSSPGNYGSNTPYEAPVVPSRQVEPPLYSTPGKSSSSYQQSSKDQTNYSSDNKKYPSEGYKEDVDPSSTSYLTQNYETSKESSYAHDGYSSAPKKESSSSYSSQESKPTKPAASYSTDTNVNQSGSAKKHYPVIIGRYQVTDSTAFLPKKVDGGSTSTSSKTSSGKPVAAGSHVHGANGEEYVVYYLPYGQPLPIPIRKKRGTNPIVYLRSLADHSRPSRGQSEEIMDVLLPEQVHKNVLANQAAEGVSTTQQEPAEHRDQPSGIIDGASVVPDNIQEEEDEALDVLPESSPEFTISGPSVSEENISPVVEVLEDEKAPVSVIEETSNPSEEEDASLLEKTNGKEKPLSVDEVITNPEEESSDGSSAERGISFADFVSIKSEKEDHLESFVKPSPLEEIAFDYPHKNRQESSKSVNENKKPEEVETSTVRILPGLTQRPVEYLKPPGLAEEVEDHWNGYSAWWTKLGNRIAKIYRYE